MQGLMQDFPLTLPHFHARAERLFADKQVVTVTAAGKPASPTASGPSAPGASAGCSTSSASPPTAGSAPSAGTRPATSSCTSPRPAPAGCCTPSTSGSSPSSSSTSPTTPRTRSSSSTSRSPGCSWPLFDKFATVRHIVVMDDGTGDVPDAPAGKEVHDYEELLAGADPGRRSDVDDENQAASMCYTSGTTGNPKGVVYSHRSTFLHTYGRAHRRRPRRRGARPRPAGRADVPRQRLGPGPRRRGLRRRPVMPGPDLSPRGAGRPHRVRAGHGRRRRAHHLDGRAARAQGPRHLRACGPSPAAARPCPRRCRRPTGSRSACRSCRRGA